MPRINRPAVWANVLQVAVPVLELLAAIVTVEAERLQLAGKELVPITVVGFDVISNRGNAHHTPLEANSAEGIPPELEATKATPALKVIPGAPRGLPWSGAPITCHAWNSKESR